MVTSKKLNSNEPGFTLIEVLVSTAIFVVVVSAMLALFNYTLKINRQVQALREVVQGTRTFAETITREIRNGRIDYSSWTSECDATNYQFLNNQSLSILSKSGDRLCFYFDSSGKLALKRQTPSGVETAEVFDSPKFTVDSTSFRFTVMPQTDPNVAEAHTSTYPRIQPFVTIAAEFKLDNGTTTPTMIDYQTTISTDVYDILK